MSQHEEDAGKLCELCGVTYDCHEVLSPKCQMGHDFYQDPQPREVGRCDFTFRDGDYCGVFKEEHR